jgi:hypothetical protein
MKEVAFDQMEMPHRGGFGCSLVGLGIYQVGRTTLWS